MHCTYGHICNRRAAADVNTLVKHTQLACWKHPCKQWNKRKLITRISTVTVCTDGQLASLAGMKLDCGSVPISVVLPYCEVRPLKLGAGGEAPMRSELHTEKGQMDRLTFPDPGSDCRLSSELGSCSLWRGCWPFPWTSPHSLGSILKTSIHNINNWDINKGLDVRYSSLMCSDDDSVLSAGASSHKWSTAHFVYWILFEIGSLHQMNKRAIGRSESPVNSQQHIFVSHVSHSHFEFQLHVCWPLKTGLMTC